MDPTSDAYKRQLLQASAALDQMTAQSREFMEAVPTDALLVASVSLMSVGTSAEALAYMIAADPKVRSACAAAAAVAICSEVQHRLENPINPV